MIVNKWKYNSLEELEHGFKYIKKIKTANGVRYFYTQAEIDAYNQGLNDGANRPRPRKKTVTGEAEIPSNTLPSNRPRPRKKTVTGEAEIPSNTLPSNRPRPRKKTVTGKAETFINKTVRSANNEAAGAKRAVEIWKKPKYKKGDKMATYSPIYKDKYYDEVKVTSVKNNKNGGQTVTADYKKRKKKKTTKLERASLRAYRYTHPHE
jgi:hypothetical protein